MKQIGILYVDFVTASALAGAGLLHHVNQSTKVELVVISCNFHIPHQFQWIFLGDQKNAPPQNAQLPPPIPPRFGGWEATRRIFWGGSVWSNVPEVFAS